jgi:hypothetical protein
MEPRLGETMATLCEAPFLLIAIVLAARSLPKMLKLRANLKSLAAMGIGALFLQQLADFAVGSFLHGITPAQQITRFARAAGLIYCGVILLFTFVCMPVLATRPQWRLHDAHEQ